MSLDLLTRTNNLLNEFTLVTIQYLNDKFPNKQCKLNPSIHDKKLKCI